MKLTPEHLHAICGERNFQSRKIALCKFMNDTAARHCDVMAPHRLAQFLAQVMHESGRLRFVKEVWGPTDAQMRYEGRRDLGNIHQGDGRRFQGRDIIQVTGRANYRSLTVWARSTFGARMPNFEGSPDALCQPQHLGLGALWYWITRVPAKYVDSGDIEMITRRINGGLTGYADRLALYDRAALVLLGMDPANIRGFQRTAGVAVDGVSGPKTRAAMHARLAGLNEALPALGSSDVPGQGVWSALVAAILNFFDARKATK